MDEYKHAHLLSSKFRICSCSSEVARDTATYAWPASQITGFRLVVKHARQLTIDENPLQVDFEPLDGLSLAWSSASFDRRLAADSCGWSKPAVSSIHLVK